MSSWGDKGEIFCSLEAMQSLSAVVEAAAKAYEDPQVHVYLFILNSISKFL